MIEAGNRWDESPSLRENREKTDHKRREVISWRKSVELCNTASRLHVVHLSSASADFCRFYNFKTVKIPENARFPGFSYIRSICSVFKKSDGI